MTFFSRIFWHYSLFYVIFSSVVTDSTATDIRIDFSNVDSPCMRGLNCFHGKCHTEIANSKNRCVCEAVWQGPFCNIKIPNLDQPPTDLPKVVEEPSIFDIAKIKSSDGEENKLYKREDSVKSSNTGKPLNSCSKNYKLRPLSDRQCFPNFVCQYGECRKKRIENYIHLECVCDLGVYGLFCQHRCCLDCGNNGICAIGNGETEPFCKCREGFVGWRCNIQKNLTEHNTRTESLLRRMSSHIQSNSSMSNERQELHTTEIDYFT
ncbi:hypothetical protein CHS0354_010763 [Potamilus streckersoni]|uniref:EGF-like domain-containing protein n=1 Tax=Potamilus streckersoni TaxID=2493646 RepID=A0AAE0W9K6_9BIVA|nr:hypothetical protein CHS0354_010763 [Potamilus streckersoni]